MTVLQILEKLEVHKMLEEIQKSLKNNFLFRPNYFTYIFGPLCLGAVLIWQSPLWIPFVQIILIISYKSGVKNYQKKVDQFSNFMSDIIQNVEKSNHHIISHMQVGLAVFSSSNHLQWCNHKFNEIVNKNNTTDCPLEQLLPVPAGTFTTLLNKDSSRRLISIGDFVFSMESRQITDQDKKSITGKSQKLTGLAIYLYDFTNFVALQKQYQNEKLALCYIRFDNYDEITHNLPENGIINLHAQTTEILTKWANEYNGFIVTMNNEFSLVGFSNENLKNIIKNKFDILDELHNTNTSSHMNPTFSIGVAVNADNLSTLFSKAQKALDMALNRGGDQTVIDNNGRLSYFGATGTVVAKTNKVRARIMAKELRDQMNLAENIIVMGHTKEDFDSYGASVGIACMAKFLNKPVNIAIGYVDDAIKRSFQLLKPLGITDTYEKITVIGKEEALKLVTPNTLLIMVDHHRRQLGSIPELIDTVQQKIIIDHHRRSEDIIKDTTLLYQEPSSSSTSELITEFFQYFDESLKPTSLEATCLYNGILLDTKNFNIQTGDRTFEAAALLRRSGANIRIANELFSDTFDDVRIKAKLLSETRLVANGFVIATYKNAENNQKTNTIAAQVADKLILSNEVHGSCVITEYKEGGCAVSARSDGTIFNVQIIMEALGGGGHQLAAACQLTDKNAKEAETLILNEVAKQLEEK